MKYLEMLGRVSLASVVAAPFAIATMLFIWLAAMSDLVWLCTHFNFDNKWNERVSNYLDEPGNSWMRFGTWYENVIRRILGLTEV